jgi:hypothetical protein
MMLNTLDMASHTITDRSPFKLVIEFSNAEPSACPSWTVAQQSVINVKRSSSESFAAIVLKAPKSEGA